MMVTEKRLIDQLREMADRTPPICQYDKPEKTMIFGKEITVYCKPFEQFQELLRRAADALDVDSVPGPSEADPNIMELCFHNGEIHMKEKVVSMLDAFDKDYTLGDPFIEYDAIRKALMDL
jgi:hypothetical protein